MRKSWQPSRDSVGSRAERRAAWHYRLRGYRILARNAWAGGYELDLIARRGGTVVFCEVKAKSGSRYGSPLEMVGEEKRRRIRQAAEAWLARHPEHRDLALRFEVAGIRGRELRVVRAELDPDDVRTSVDA